MKSPCSWIAFCLCLIALSGCNGGQPAPVAEGEADEFDAPGAATGGNPPVAAIGAGQLPPKQNAEPLGGFDLEAADDPEADVSEALTVVEGSPDWLLQEIAKIKVEPLPPTEDVEALRAVRKERNDKIIDLAAQCIAKTHQRKEDERLFDVAIHHMLEARLQLSLQGERESIDALYDDAASLWERDPKSKAAAEAAVTLVNLAYTNARATAAKDPQWLREFVRQASQFASNFPNEERRSVPLLFSAAYSCELHGLTDEATKAYSLLKEKFPQSTQAQRVTGILRRLKLVGQPLQFGGPTLGGGFLNIDQLAGRVVVIAYWSAVAKPTQESVAPLKALQAKFGKYGVKVVGVCLDSDETVVKTFIEEQQLDWPQIFHTEAGQQGWNNPIVNYYGVLEVGNWLVDQQGQVVSTGIAAADLEQQIIPLLKRGANREPSPPR